MVLGVAIILADFTVPESVDTTLMYFIGFSLIALGVWVLTGIFFQGSNFRLKSRWMLIRDGLFKGVKRIQRTPRGRSISLKHSHGHHHDSDVELHEHSHESGSSNAEHHHVHKHELFLDQESLSSPTAIGVGVLHGIGVETPTQIAIFVATTQATGKTGGLLILVFWVVGLILANSAIALLSIGANDWLRTHTVFYRVLAAIIGIVSIIVGILVIIEKDGILPAF